MNKWNKILGIHRNVPRTSYILRLVVGAYLLYLVYQIVRDLGTSTDVNPNIMMAAAGLFCLVAIYCLLSGGLGMYQKEYRESYAEQAAETKKTDASEEIEGIEENEEAESEDEGDNEAESKSGKEEEVNETAQEDREDKEEK